MRLGLHRQDCLPFRTCIVFLRNLILVRFSQNLGTNWEPRHGAVPHCGSTRMSPAWLPSFGARLRARTCRRSPLGYPSLANSASFCTALWCSFSASLAMRCTLSRAELRTARLCSNGVALSNRWIYKSINMVLSPYLIWYLLQIHGHEHPVKGSCVCC
jgi:hypothetical protein